MSEPMSSSTKRWLILAALLLMQTLGFVYALFLQHVQIKDLQGDCETLYAKDVLARKHLEKELSAVYSRLHGEFLIMQYKEGEKTKEDDHKVDQDAEKLQRVARVMFTKDLELEKRINGNDTELAELKRVLESLKKELTLTIALTTTKTSTVEYLVLFQRVTDLEKAVDLAARRQLQ